MHKNHRKMDGAAQEADLFLEELLPLPPPSVPPPGMAVDSAMQTENTDVERIVGLFKEHQQE
jgi:hypothetical protein